MLCKCDRCKSKTSGGFRDAFKVSEKQSGPILEHQYHMRSGNETVTKLIEHKIHLVTFSAVYVLSALEQFI